MANNDAKDFEALARQYWGAWGDAMRGAAPQQAAQSGAQGWQDAMNAWAGSAGGAANPFGNVLDHFKSQNHDWYAQMQQVAAQFAGRDHSPQDVAQAWKQALGMAGANPFPQLFSSMRGPGLEGLEQWNEAAAPWLQGMRSEATSMLGMPAFGFTREHQERMQAMAQAHLRWQDSMGAYNALMAKSSQAAYARFESKLAERDEPGRQIGSARALFDLWIDAAEEAYAETALSLEYRQAYGAMVNAQMQLRASLQSIAEQTAGVLGLPGRGELDSAHRKIAELERQLRRMQRKADDEAALPPASKAAVRKAPATKAAPIKQAARPAAKKTATKSAKTRAEQKTARKSVQKKAVKAPVRKPASRKR
ncbi:MAG: class III poly(R)-hydroxyalkanoic acid synthase subunit PhaE [Pseudomonadota bacterium]|nr:class III poly(R)-hydroxyalkanoic acid synthase subunit PhaE [Pseudomonadota bacterium]